MKIIFGKCLWTLSLFTGSTCYKLDTRGVTHCCKWETRGCKVESIPRFSLQSAVFIGSGIDDPFACLLDPCRIPTHLLIWSVSLLLKIEHTVHCNFKIRCVRKRRAAECAANNAVPKNVDEYRWFPFILRLLVLTVCFVWIVGGQRYSSFFRLEAVSKKQRDDWKVWEGKSKGKTCHHQLNKYCRCCLNEDCRTYGFAHACFRMQLLCLWTGFPWSCCFPC